MVPIVGVEGRKSGRKEMKETVVLTSCSENILLLQIL